jgi:hypothetical protein
MRKGRPMLPYIDPPVASRLKAEEFERSNISEIFLSIEGAQGANSQHIYGTAGGVKKTCTHIWCRSRTSSSAHITIGEEKTVYALLRVCEAPVVT